MIVTLNILVFPDYYHSLQDNLVCVLFEIGVSRFFSLLAYSSEAQIDNGASGFLLVWMACCRMRYCFCSSKACCPIKFYMKFIIHVCVWTSVLLTMVFSQSPAGLELEDDVFVPHVVTVSLLCASRDDTTPSQYSPFHCRPQVHESGSVFAIL